MTDQSFALLSVRMFAAGTRLRTGLSPDDFTAVEDLSAGEAVYDPVSRRFHDILDMSCNTLDHDRARQRGLDMFQLAAFDPATAATATPVTCLIESRDLAPLPRPRPTPRPEAEPAVFYRLNFGSRVVVDTGTALCEVR